MKLLAGINHFVGQLSGQRLQHRDFPHALPILGGQPAAVIKELPRRVSFRFKHCQALAYHLLVEQHAAESLAVFDIFDGESQRGQRIADGHRGGCDTLALEILHDRIESGVLFAQQISRGHAAVFEDQFRGVGTQPAGLVQRAANAKTRRAFFDDEHGDAAGTLRSRIGFRRHKVQIGLHAIGDEHLGAVQYPIGAVDSGASADAGDVGSRIGLGHRHRGNAFSTNDRRQIFFQLCAGPGIHQVGRSHVRMNQRRHDESAECAARQRLRKDQRSERIGFRTTELGRVGNAEKAQFAHFAQDFARDKALLLPCLAMRFDFLCNKPRDLIAQRDVLFGEIDGFHVLLG